MSGRLVVCPTPIGNLEDITLRVLAALREADVIACEDTRHTQGLLRRHGIEARLVSYHEHNERARAAELVERMREGATVALVSDAGMPLVSDPGYDLVQAAIAADLRVEVLPGPSATLTALVASGLPNDAWRFAGFLPRKAGPLREVFAAPETVVAFESPRRVGASLKILADLDPERPVAVCRELTKLHEEIVRGSAAELAGRYADQDPRGEIVLVIGGAPKSAGLDPEAVEAVRALVDAGARAKTAAKVVSDLTGAPSNELYRALLT
ncbi:16S rRNA (cytidine(1402)-2'-O)-methyltransferase [Solirubrobacter sp. CPCC 204708]|uniref:Ribosomal RNA small subunit methyltransferase I n=1 Tax=Solirubrobacter deserti TaxID=2282478 RepID=A0ABT4RI05_9ACTN|nr:16S rRNA (cytidine(1402)-2'-O)-methyltransferase [Solirubrobacter deserti]MBE2318804.1 16S rRNA (cytidine(1402)-2'-O)-methyltransferase [Solirubrobacter deserti]MDA0138184.1 16S rRNA (cytidine(1402)-2'-O)-methyltransferase [Solirubrobacter deserti]